MNSNDEDFIKMPTDDIENATVQIANGNDGPPEPNELN